MGRDASNVVVKSGDVALVCAFARIAVVCRYDDYLMFGLDLIANSGIKALLYHVVECVKTVGRLDRLTRDLTGMEMQVYQN